MKRYIILISVLFCVFTKVLSQSIKWDSVSAISTLHLALAGVQSFAEINPDNSNKATNKLVFI